MNDDNPAGCLFIALMVIILVGAGACLTDDNNENYKEGYVQALVDIERKRPLRYKRVEQENGETLWIKNEEKGSGK